MAGKRGNLCFAAFAWQLMSLRHMALRACAKYVCCVSYDVLILRHGVVKRIVVCCLWTLLCGRDLLEPSTAQVCWCVCVVRNWRVWKSSLSFCIPWTDVQTCGVVLMDAFFFLLYLCHNTCKCDGDTKGLSMESLRQILELLLVMQRFRTVHHMSLLSFQRLWFPLQFDS